MLRLLRLLTLFCSAILALPLITLARLADTFYGHPNVTLWFTRRAYRWLLWVMNVRIQVIGQDNHDHALVASNHISWLDIPVLGSQLPTIFLSKAEVQQIPLLGWLATQAGTLFIHRGSGDVERVRSIIQQRLEADQCLTFFPEATTGNGWAIRQFHPRLFAAAIDTGAPVLPVALDYHYESHDTNPIAFTEDSLVSNVWRVMARKVTHVTVHLLPLIQTSELDRRTLADTALNQIADALALPIERRGLGFRAPLPTTPPANSPVQTQIPSQ